MFNAHIRAARILGCLLLAVGLASTSEATTIRVHYDVGYGNRITIRGDKAPLSWTAGTNATWTSGNVWTLNVPDSMGDVTFKPLKNDTDWSTGGNYRAKAGTTVNVYPFFGQSKGSLTKVHNFYSPQLNNSRTLVIYLPPSYYENPLKRYPVIYAHDGQNLFEASTASYGVEWGVDETINSRVGTGEMDEVIVVGMHHAGSGRIYEYTPCCDPSYGGGGADKYKLFVIDTVKPYVDSNFRTLWGKEYTGLMGSSLGGLVSFYMARRHPDVFSKAACLSSSFWWNNQALTREVEQSTWKAPVKFYLDAGTSSDGLTETNRMRDALLADGHAYNVDLFHYVANGAGHTESAWAARVYIPLMALYPWQSTVW
jgi:predicted alpha/beta superfamily hydrolase